ncbi:MAG: 30S ribosomal protein S20 [Desulfobacula sp.]|nr:30S ribosomal protein S20 [Desulfobacula sp.]
MANHKSAKKRAKQSQVRRLRNRSVKTTLKNMEKKVHAAKEDGGENKDDILRKTQSAIQKAAKKGVLHKKTASRKISRLFKFMNT